MEKINIYSSPKETNHKKTVDLVRLIKNNENLGKIATINYAWLDKDKALDPHTHPDGIEYYIFVKGVGEILIEEKWHQVKKGDFITIPTSTLHSLKNTSTNPLEFITIRTLIE